MNVREASFVKREAPARYASRDTLHGISNKPLISSSEIGIKADMDSVHIKVHGMVQGVFFRANTQKEAARLKLGGWVRNTEDGGVEIEAWGDKLSLEKFINWCRMGPEHARVDRIEASWTTTEGAVSGFHIRY